MNKTHDEATRYAGAPWAEGGTVDELPEIRINVFGGFEVIIDGRPIDYGCIRQRRVKTLLCILALNHGQELFSTYVAESIWPRSPGTKQRNSFYNLWYLLVHALVPEGVDKTAYFSREQYSCRLRDNHVSTDVADAERACEELSDPQLDPVRALSAYNLLRRSYRGDVLPGEEGNSIIDRARREWRERVVDSLFAAAKSMSAQGEASTALCLVKAACRIDEYREDLVNLRMRLLIDLGRPAAALRAYNDMQDHLMAELGVAPSEQSRRLVQEVVNAEPLCLNIPLPPSSQGRRRGRPAQSQRRRRAAAGRPADMRV